MVAASTQQNGRGFAEGQTARRKLGQIVLASEIAVKVLLLHCHLLIGCLRRGVASPCIHRLWWFGPRRRWRLRRKHRPWQVLHLGRLIWRQLFAPPKNLPAIEWSNLLGCKLDFALKGTPKYSLLRYFRRHQIKQKILNKVYAIIAAHFYFPLSDIFKCLLAIYRQFVFQFWSYLN